MADGGVIIIAGAATGDPPLVAVGITVSLYGGLNLAVGWALWVGGFVESNGHVQ